MSVQIQLDNPHSFFTNLDFISGKVILKLPSDENVAAIIVKLEGESKTMLLRAPGFGQLDLYSRRNNRRDQMAFENHKILYRVQQVFPPPNSRAGGAFSLSKGQYEYPFRFKMPFNNSCADPQQMNMVGGGGLGGFGLSGLQQMQYRHIKRTLPPSLTGFPDEAEIRYYIKVTVQRPSVFKENRRAEIGFKFMPTEPPRQPPSQNEVFARRPYLFEPGAAPARKGMFKKTQAPEPSSGMAPKGEVDARLPSPAILTCNQPIPLRLLFKNSNISSEQVSLVSMQVTLFGFTEIRALDLMRVETGHWILLNLQGLHMPIGSPESPPGTEFMLDSSLWSQIILPSTVSPTFYTCNISRRYELEVRLTLSYGDPSNVQVQPVTVPLRFQIEIYSGLAPPPELLAAITNQPLQVPVSSTGGAPAYDPAYPPQVGSAGAPDLHDAPPSYEDAVADEFSVVANGPRPEFSGVTNENGPSMNEKGSAAPKYSTGPNDEKPNPYS